ncbi:hypothetical protein BX600DRAFT_132121 [Xylariales sp. PMI_506]|nr:hypothetical protein BX600DRAFT_132121 [Xylariales sp. PMI_506]
MSSGGGSGGGGYFRYRCKYFYTHNCPNWVYVNNSPCSSCCAEGRDADGEHHGDLLDLPTIGLFPRVEDIPLYYATTIEIATHESRGQRHPVLAFTFDHSYPSFPVPEFRGSVRVKSPIARDSSLADQPGEAEFK